MNILLTGGNGFIGSSFRLSSPHKIFPLYRNVNYSYKENSVFIDLTNKKHIINLVSDLRNLKIDAIVHTAAITPFSLKNKLNYHHDIVMAEHIIYLVEKLNIRKVLFTSGWNIYDPLSHIPIKENSDLKPNTDYGISKMKVEAIFKNSLKHAFLINVRFSSIYGPKQTSSGLIPNSVHSAFKSHTITINSLNTKRDYLYIGDTMTAMNKLLSLSRKQLLDINIGSATSYSVQTIITIIQQIMKKKYNIDVALILKINPTETVPADNRLDISKAHQVINFEPSTKLINGLENYIAWIKQNE